MQIKVFKQIKSLFSVGAYFFLQWFLLDPYPYESVYPAVFLLRIQENDTDPQHCWHHLDPDLTIYFNALCLTENCRSSVQNRKKCCKTEKSCNVSGSESNTNKFFYKAVHVIFCGPNSLLFLLTFHSVWGMPLRRKRKKRSQNETKRRSLHQLPYIKIVKSGTSS